MENEIENENAKISYWESRTINIGHYEKREFGLSFSLLETKINEKEKTVTVSHSESIKANLKNCTETASLIMNRVNSVLNKKEALLRECVALLEGDDQLDHRDKLRALDIVVSDEILERVDKIKKRIRSERKKAARDFEEDEE